MCYAKAIVAIYGGLDEAIEEMGERAKRRCYASFYETLPCETEAMNVIKLYDMKYKLIELKEKLDLVFSRFKENDRLLVLAKTLDNQLIDQLAISRRTYFRRKKSLYATLEEYLGYIKLGFDDLMNNYGEVPFIRIMIENSKPLDEEKAS